MSSPSNGSVIVTLYTINGVWQESGIPIPNSSIVAISPCTDIGSGTVPSLVLTLNAFNGQFITTQGTQGSNGFPVIDRFSILSVLFEDPNGNSFLKFFVVDTLKPLESRERGDRLEVHAFGMEYWMQRLDFAKQYYFADAFSTFVDILNKYNANKGTAMPTILTDSFTTSTYIQIPNWTANMYMFNMSETSCYAGLTEIIDRLGSPVTAGGAGDFFEMKVTDLPGTNGPQFYFNVFSSGNPTSGPTKVPVIDNSNSVLIETNGDIESPQGTLVMEWGDDQLGSLPINFSQYAGIDEAYFLFPNWTSSITYPLGAYVTYSGTVYQSAIANNTSTPPNNWNSISETQWVNQQYANGFTAWVSGNSYPQGALVSYGTAVYQSNINNNTSTPGSGSWTVINFQYSPWTFGSSTNGSGASVWYTSMAGYNITKYSGVTPFGNCAWDANVVIQDGNYYRTWCDARATSVYSSGSTLTTTLAPFGIIGTDGQPHLYRGFRVLVDTSGGTISLGPPFSNGLNGSHYDRFGNDYTDALVMNNGAGTGTYLDWDVFMVMHYTTPYASALPATVGWEIANMDDAIVYRWQANSIGCGTGNAWNGQTTYSANTLVLYNGIYYKNSATITSSVFNKPPPLDSRWTNVSVSGIVRWNSMQGCPKGNDCFHPVGQVFNAQGTAANPSFSGANQTLFPNGGGSAVGAYYSFNPAGTALSSVWGTSGYYSMGAWLNIRFPLPIAQPSGFSQLVGSLYGYNNNLCHEQSNNNELEPATVDSLNMHLTPSGNSGFNAIDSESLGNLYAFAFQTKLLLTDNSGSVPNNAQPNIGNLLYNLTGTAANFKMRCLLFDTNDNVVYQDFTIAFNNVWQDVILPISQFQIYRGRIPLMVGDVNALTPIPQLNVLNVFFWRNIKQCVIQWQEVYDDQGRYKPETSGGNAFSFLVSGGLNAISTVRSWLFVDSVRFAKPILAIAGQSSTVQYILQPESVQRKEITNYYQLKQTAMSDLQIYQWRHLEYKVMTNLRCDIQFGGSFYYYNPNVVPAVYTDYNGMAGSVKLVAKQVDYYLNKTDGGPGGLITELDGVRRYPVSGAP